MLNRRAFLCAGSVALLSPPRVPTATAQSRAPLLLEPATLLSTGERIDFVGENTMGIERTRWGTMLRSTPNNSASGIYQKMQGLAQMPRSISWQWLVEPLQRSADLRAIEREDTGACLMLVFGTPSYWNRDVPTLAYTWTSTPVDNGSILPSLRYASLRYIQLHGPADSGSLQKEERDIAGDYLAAFNLQPPALEYVAIFNDNDQTHEPTSALFGSISLAS